MDRRNFTLALLAATAPMALTRTAVAQTAPGAIPAMQYLAMASKGSSFLYSTARDAYDKSQNPMVRRFALAEVNEQATLTAKLNGATGGAAGGSAPGGVVGGLVAAPLAVAGGVLGAVESILGVPMTSDAQKADMVARIQSMPGGPGYDLAFVNAQILGHNEAYGIHGSYAQSGDDPVLRRVARNAIPLIKLHLSQLARMQAQMGGAQG
ncbi:DUF4142 domain-containing protein [uncultured Enterovirga sp.]|uniref:DUF4142 domain-containing protein n=1 Tax=uncultured Enterovirga sp. TaxID=2026352 RepID=UPI0035CAE91B